LPKFKNTDMKKLVYAIGIVAFLVIGGFAVESAVAVQSPTDKVVYDDPPKKEKKEVKKKSCCSESAKHDCSSKSLSSHKSCNDKAAPANKETKDTSDKDKK
jgi:hypothetical protein